jgi:hypothetical protein
LIDATLADRIGCLKVEPVLCLFGNICRKKRQNASAWFILGFIPPYPKSSIKSQADHRREETKHLRMEYYHACLHSILQDLLSGDQNHNGHKMWVSGKGFVQCHFKLSLIIEDTKGHDKVCTQYCSFSSNIQRMYRDCDIHQFYGDDVNAECSFVNMSEIKGIVKEKVGIIKSREYGQVGLACAKLAKISQLPVISAFFDFNFCGDPHGVFGSCPFERLHAWLSGIMKDGMRFLFLMCDIDQTFIDWADDDNRQECQ